MEYFFGFRAFDALQYGMCMLFIAVMAFVFVRSNSILFRFLFAAATVALIVSVIVNINFYWMTQDDGYHPWPSVSECPVCEERIYAWDEFDRRDMTMAGDHTAELGGTTVSVGMSALYHSSCKGTGPEKVLHIEVH